MENYEEKYKEALEGIQEILSSGQDTIKMSRLKLRLQGIFPELKESEDEKIRKELIEHCKNQAKPYIDTGNECPQIQSWIDWLEKQGEPNPYSGTSFKYNGHTWGMCARDKGVEILIDGHLKGRVFTDNDSNAKEMFIKALECVEEQNSKGYKLTDCDKNSWWEDFKAYTSYTIEQKPQGKSALEAINEENVGNPNCGNENVPALAKTKDERIRKAIYDVLKYLETDCSWDSLDEEVDILDAYDWLKKQGNQKEQLNNKACDVLVNCIEDFMLRRMETWDEECKKQTLENIRKKLEE